MLQECIVIEHKSRRKMGLKMLARAALTAVAFYLLRDQFEEFTVKVFFPLIVATELVYSVYYVLTSRNCETINAEGITTQTLFGTTTYSWQDVKRFDIEWLNVKKSFPEKKIPVIHLSCGTLRRKITVRYSEDAEQYIRRFYGAPDYDECTDEIS